jgi:hypothetical protein
MLVPLGIIAAEGIFLYILSRQVVQLLYVFWFFVTRSRKVALTILMLFMFPGTVLHELAHMFTAEIMGVPTGKLTLAPESLDDDSIRSGSVAIAQTDPFRRTLIGIAPIIWGIATLSAFAYWFPGVIAPIETALPTLFSGPVDARPFLLAVALLYGTFTVSNAMFTSHEDMKGAWPLLIVIGVVVGALTLMGVRITLPANLSVILSTTLWSLSQTLGWVVALNLIILLTTSFLIAMTGKMRR